jgi:hypothetical protein
MSNKRGSRGKSKSTVFKSCVVLGKIKYPRQETLDLLGIVGMKPHINDVMPSIISRIEEAKRAKILSMARSWQRGNNWHDMLYECMGEDDYVIDEEDYDMLYDGLGRKLSVKQLKRLNKKLYGGGKKRDKAKYTNYHDDEEDDYWNNRSTMFTHGEWSDDDDEDGYEEPYKSIKFYPDIEDEMTYKEFFSLKEFDEFCKEHNYYVGSVDFSNLTNMSVVHCCLDPIDLEYGDNTIITDSSYGGLYWSVSEDLSKKEAMSHEPHYES